MNRRDLLVASSTGLLLGSAGCLDTPDRDTEPREEDNDQNEDSGGNGVFVGPYDDWEVKQFAVSSSADWWSDGTDRTGYVELFTSRESALDVLDFDRVDEVRRDVVRSFVEDTNYRGVPEGPGEWILYIESVGPHAGYDELEIPDFAPNNTVTGTAKAKQTSEGEAEEPTFPSALVQARADSSSYNITVIDGWGDEAEVGGSAHGHHHSPIELDWVFSLVDLDYESYEPTRRSGTGSTITDSVELRGGFHALYFDGNPAGSTVDLVRADTGERETRLVDETAPSGGTVGTFSGEYGFVPPSGTYRLDVVGDADWDLTVVDLADFRSNTSYEAVFVAEVDDIHASDEINASRASYEVHVPGAGNQVIGAVRLSPGMRITLAENESDVPPTVTAYTESGQQEVLFDETTDEGETVETTLDGVTWFDGTPAGDQIGEWVLHILPES